MPSHSLLEPRRSKGAVLYVLFLYHTVLLRIGNSVIASNRQALERVQFTVFQVAVRCVQQVLGGLALRTALRHGERLRKVNSTYHHPNS